MTITHPYHPLCGQRVPIVRLRQGADPDLIVRLPDGTHAAVSMSSTDYAGRAADRPRGSATRLLELHGLRQLARLLAVLRQEVRNPLAEPLRGTARLPRDDGDREAPAIP